MAADDLSKTSTNRLRVLQYNEKVASLNKQFIKQLQKWMEQVPHYDFTDTVKSYIEHMNHLSNLYSIKAEQVGTATTTTTTSIEPKSGRVIVKAKRRINRDSIDPAGDDEKTLPNVSTPAVDPPRRSFAFGNVSEIFDSSATTTPTPSTTRGKRAIRGGGLLGGEEKVIFKGAGGESAAEEDTKKYPSVTINLPKPTPDFWNKKDPSVAPGLFTFGLTKTNEKKEESNETKKDEEKIGEKKDEKKTESTPPATSAPLFGFAGFGKKTDDSTATKKDDAPPATTASKLSFPSFGSQAPAFSGFGTTTTTTTTAAPFSGFNFGGVGGAVAAAPTAADDGEGEEYVPPKAEVVEKEEADSMYSSKCSVFKMVDKEYTKLGVGMMHLKDVDGKKSVLIRAATTMGTVWANAAMNPSMKVNSVASDAKGEKLNLLFPITASEMGTFLIRFPNKAAAEKVKSVIEENIK